MEKQQVLHVLDGLNYGGAERFLLNLIKCLDKDKINSDIIVRNPQNLMALDFEEYGATIIKAPTFPKNIIKHYKYLKKFVIDNNHKYDYVHIHANSLIYVLPIFLFNKYSKETKIILHSHSSKSTNPLVTLIHKFNRPIVNKMVDVKIAVSELAGYWMFDKDEYKIIYNGIDIEKFKYNSDSRKHHREQLEITEDMILLGIIGRLTPVKNHDFLLNVFKELTMVSNQEYKLVIVGSGEIEEKLKDMVKKLDLMDRVIFTGSINDIPGILSAMDIFLQPSLFEGFPFTVIEAQVSNVPVIISDRITTEVIISEKLIRLSLENITTWVDNILSVTDFSKRSEYSQVDFAKIDMVNIAKDFEENVYN